MWRRGLLQNKKCVQATFRRKLKVETHKKSLIIIALCVCVNSWIPVGQQSSQELSPHRHKHLPETHAHRVPSQLAKHSEACALYVCVLGGSVCARRHFCTELETGLSHVKEKIRSTLCGLKLKCNATGEWSQARIGHHPLFIQGDLATSEHLKKD